MTSTMLLLAVLAGHARSERWLVTLRPDASARLPRPGARAGERKRAFDRVATSLFGKPRAGERRFWIARALALPLTASEVARMRRRKEVARVDRADRRAWIWEDVARSARRFRARDGVPAYGLLKIRLHDLWASRPEIDGSEIRVGVMDTGIEAKHPALQGRLATWVDVMNGEKEPYDDHGHGTHVSGTIAGSDAIGETAIGVAPRADLVVIKAFDSHGSSTWEKVIEGLERLADPDGDPETADAPHVVSNSWGVGTPSEDDNPADFPFCVAVDQLRELGVVPVFAAGNYGPGAETVSLPGACPGAVAVGATDSSDRIASFSGRGPAKWKTGDLLKPEVVAPGVDILSSVVGGGLGTKSGTSMATPHVAGLAALIRQAHADESVERVVERLRASAEDLGASGVDNTFGSGRIDAWAAIGD